MTFKFDEDTGMFVRDNEHHANVCMEGLLRILRRKKRPPLPFTVELSKSERFGSVKTKWSMHDLHWCVTRGNHTETLVRSACNALGHDLPPVLWLRIQEDMQGILTLQRNGDGNYVCPKYGLWFCANGLRTVYKRLPPKFNLRISTSPTRGKKLELFRASLHTWWCNGQPFDTYVSHWLSTHFNFISSNKYVWVTKERTT